MSTARLDALLLIAAVAKSELWFGIVLTEVWEKWRLDSDLAGAGYMAVPYNPVSVHVVATHEPPGQRMGVYLLPAEQATTEMQKRMAAALDAGWPGTPDMSEKWASNLDHAEQALRGRQVPWSWPSPPSD
jgi:hypothetical protein